MTAFHAGLRACAALGVLTTVLGATGRAPDQLPPSRTVAIDQEPAGRPPNFPLQLQQQAEIDKTWRAASEGVMRMEKISYASRADGLSIPAFLFEPLQLRGPKGHAALVWVHPDIRGRLYTYYIPYIREAVARGYVVIAPEYRGSLGYGERLYDAIDYGGAEVDDVATAVEYLKTRMPQVDPARVGIIGWSHGGMIAVLAITREPSLFAAAAALVPVTNLFQRLAWKGVDRQHQLIDPANRLGGLPSDHPEVYRERSPVYQIDKLKTPLLVHVTKNDTDVNIEEDMQLVDALRSRKADLAETRVYDNPKGGHLFDRQVDSTTWQPENTREQRDSWNRVWTFLDWHLDPYRDVPSK
jgi:dipeptidyl aminopeptidase/acylaminoacyl peptidase